MAPQVPHQPTTPSAIGRTLAALGDEWSLLIVRAALWGAHRFGEFRERLSISESVLASRLVDLVDFGVLELDDDGAYRLTAAGAELWPVLVGIWQWERSWVAGQADALPDIVHDACGAATSVHVACAHCGDAVAWEDLDVEAPSPDAFARCLPDGTRRRRRSIRTEDPLGLGNYDATMELIGSRWSSAMLGAALLGCRRFGEFEALTGATPAIVSERLRAFVRIGVLDKVDGAYRLTDAGRGFLIVVAPFIAWAQRFAGVDDGALVVRHRGCGQLLMPRLGCDRCGEAFRPAGSIAPAGR